MESLGALASGIAHDLNNVLSPILMSIEILKKRYSDDRPKELLATIEAAARRAADLVKQALSFGRGLEETQEVLQAKHIIGEIMRIIQETFPKSIQMTASEGAEAIAVYVENQEDVELVITDMMMPVMDGPATARALKRLNPNLKIIAIGGLLHEKAPEMRSLGICDFLAKPFTAEDLHQMLQKAFFNS